MIDFTWQLALSRSGPGLRSPLTSHQTLEGSDADDRATSLMFYFYQILISRERGRDHHPPPSSCSPPPPEISPVPDQTETLRRKYQGPVRQKTHNQYVWVTVCFWSALIWFLPISLSVSPPARSFPYFWFMIIKKQLMFVINIMQMDSGRRGRRSITMMDDWCGQLQLKTGIFYIYILHLIMARCFVPHQPYPSALLCSQVPGER